MSDDELPSENPQLAMAGVDAHLEAKTSLKILQGRYVHFSSLLQNHKTSQKLVISKAEGQLTSVSSNRKLYNFNEWLDAFIIYAAVRVSGHPNEAVPLFKYLQTIKRIQARGGNFVVYDENFRSKHKGQPNIPWQQLDTEEFSWAASDPSYTPYEELQKRKLARFKNHSYNAHLPVVAKTGCCYAFNSNSGCRAADCRYKHCCRKCAGQHPITACGQSTDRRPNASSGSRN